MISTCKSRQQPSADTFPRTTADDLAKCKCSNNYSRLSRMIDWFQSNSIRLKCFGTIWPTTELPHMEYQSTEVSAIHLNVVIISLP